MEDIAAEGLITADEWMAERVKVSPRVGEGQDFAIATNENSAAHDLAALAGAADVRIRWAAASNKATPPEILMNLSNDPAPEVQEALAGNAMTPPETLAGLVSAEAEKNTLNLIAETQTRR